MFWIFQDLNFGIFLTSAVAAFVPVAFWFFIVKRKKREQMTSRFALTFLLAGAGAFVIFNFQEPVQEILFEENFSVFWVFAAFGIGIEYFKNLVVRIAGTKYFRDVDDVMDLSFASALGFTFFENIFHFYFVFSGGDAEFLGPVKGIKYFLHREFFILPIHLFCSGIFGYFYAMGIFSNSELKRRNLSSPVFRIFYLPLRILLFFLSPSRVFKIVKIMQGTIVSVFFYALFFTVLQFDPMLSDLFRLFGFLDQGATAPVDEKLMPLISFAFFKVGTVLLFNLMDRKNRWANREMLH